MIYFDNASTTPLAPQVIELLNELNKSSYANPSSIHSLGRQASKRLESARKSLAKIINAKPEEIIFTSGATEANNTVFNIINCDLIITSPAEHASIIEPAKKSCKPIIWLNLDQEGFIDLEELQNHLKLNQGKKILVSIMHGNNEIGTINDIQAIAKLCDEYRDVIFHSDCVQSFAKHAIDVEASKIKLLTASAHKIHGPKGIGLLYINSKLDKEWFSEDALLFGGGQENDRRSGTENFIGILGFALAAELSNQAENKIKLAELYKYLFDKFKTIPGLVINGPQDLNKRVLGNLNFSLVDMKLLSEELVLQMDLQNVCISSGSACSSNRAAKEEPQLISSYVLRACGISESIAAKAARISISRLNSIEEIDQVCALVNNITQKFRLSQKVG